MFHSSFFKEKRLFIILYLLIYSMNVYGLDLSGKRLNKLPALSDRLKRLDCTNCGLEEIEYLP